MIEMPGMGALHGLLVLTVAILLRSYAREHDLGVV